MSKFVLHFKLLKNINIVNVQNNNIKHFTGWFFFLITKLLEKLKNISNRVPTT